ncbi:MAG: phosphoribosylanthranilate isomerase [Gemmatimonadaceae bacterium]
MSQGTLLDRSRIGLRIKICCMASVDEATLALEAGADALGLVSAMPSGPGVISDDVVQEIGGWIGPRAASVLLTSRTTAESIGAQLRHFEPAVLQLTDTVAARELIALRSNHPRMLLMPVVHVQGEGSVDEARQLAPFADAILLDSGNPGAAVKELGGTGRVHDWRVSRAIRDAVPVPLFLAGGLGPHNVAEAVRIVQPFGVDVCSGVRRDGMLDHELLLQFVRAARDES